MTRKQALARTAAAVVLAGAVAACQGDNTVSPAITSASPTQVRAARTLSNYNLKPDTVVVTFKVLPHKAVSQALAGGHKIYFSAQSICDPETSGYGPTTWETPCAPASKTVMVTARSWVDTAGHPFVEFSPALRFNPDDKRMVWLLMVDKKGAKASDGTIVFCADDGTCIDE